jgi:hypothetical protein
MTKIGVASGVSRRKPLPLTIERLAATGRPPAGPRPDAAGSEGSRTRSVTTPTAGLSSIAAREFEAARLA